ncbi:MAG: hypothetical protein CMF43_05965, partial [Legionellales bacterium]|nr:hypothetical protein [Legionellales bacterium]
MIIRSIIKMVYFRLLSLYVSLFLKSRKVKSLNDLLIKKKNILIIGKGKSLLSIPDEKLLSLLNNSDFTILCSSVDIKNHHILEKYNYDVQVVAKFDKHLTKSNVYPKTFFEQGVVKNLCINASSMQNNGYDFYLFYTKYKNYKIPLFCTDNGVNLVSSDASLYGGIGLTMVQSIISNVLSSNIESITLLGVDFYGTGYMHEELPEKYTKSYIQNVEDSVNSRKTRGIPLIKYLIALCNTKDFARKCKLNLPIEVKKFIPE